MRVARCLFCVLCALAGLPAVAAAQYHTRSEIRWGITGTIAPWQAGDRFKALHNAKALDLSGEDLRIGVTRGSTLGHEWALLFVRRTIDEGGTMVDHRNERFEFRPGVRFTGFMAERYGAFATIANRAQIGGVLAAGIARAEGTVRRVSGAADLDAGDVLTLFDKEVNFQLLVRAELAAAFKVGPGTKIRVSGGFIWPGTTAATITAMYFFGER